MALDLAEALRRRDSQLSRLAQALDEEARARELEISRLREAVSTKGSDYTEGVLAAGESLIASFDANEKARIASRRAKELEEQKRLAAHAKQVARSEREVTTR